jgi:3-carboxy-cis,cis-muconate cycloisomerase
MAISPFDSTLYRGLFGDAAMAALLCDEAEIAAMLRAEAALARVEARLGGVPAEKGEALAAALSALIIPPSALAAGLRKDGVAIPALVATLRANLPDDLSPYLHYGATSQDITDLALVLRLKDVLALLDARIATLIAALATLARAHVATPCLARTRTQQAALTLFGLKAANWLSPLLRHRARLNELRPRLLAVQFGGAAGTLEALGSHGIAVMDALAEELGLTQAAPWHTARDNIAGLGGFLALLADSLGKMAGDLLILAQSEIGEVRFAGAGGSSTLPQKQNPVLAEAVVALARFIGVQAGGLHQASLHQNERDGAAWALEWLTLPPMLAASGAITSLALEVLESLRPDAARMAANIAGTNGAVLAEAVTFALLHHLPRGEVQEVVKVALAACAANGTHLVDEVASRTPAPVDWEALRDPLRQLAGAQVLVARVLQEAEEG